MHMPNIRDVSQIARKWADVTPGRSSEYEQGVKSPKQSWASAATEAKDAYEQGIQEAMSNGSRERGIAAAGDAKWQRGAVTKGVSRFGPGVRAAQQDYQTGFAPYQSVISGTSLPPRGPKGDPRNYDRARIMGEALHAAKAGK